MAIVTIEGSGKDPTDLPTSLDIENNNQNKVIDVLEGEAKYQGKPFLYSSQGSVDGNPAGVVRKYHDRSVTEFFFGDNFDPFRKEINSEWAPVSNKDGTLSDFIYKISPDSLNSNTFQLTGREWGFSTQVSVTPIDISDDEQDLFVRRERVVLTIPKSEFNAVAGAVVGNTTFADWLSTKFDFTKEFTDSVFQMTLPVNKRVAAITNSGIKPSIAEVKGNYNYEIPKYENEIVNVTEQLLQNIYALFSAIEYSDVSANPSIDGYIDHATLKGQVDVVLQNLLKKSEDFDFATASYSLYIEAWTRAIKILKSTPNGQETLDELSKKFKYLVFPQSEKELFNAFNDLIELFPMYVELEMSTDNLSPLSTALEEMKISLGLLLFLVLGEMGSVPKKENTIEVQETTYDTNEGEEDDVFVSRQSIFQGVRENWDIIAWFRFLKTLPDPTVLLTETLDEIAVLGDGDFEFKTAMTPENALYRKLLLTVFESKLRTLVKDRFRSFKDIIRGRKCASETIVYKVQKWSVDQNNNPVEIIQSFWIPNVGDQNIVKLFDTQVKYNVPYIYKVNCYQLVYGTKYKYDTVLQFNDSITETETNYKYQFIVETKPYVRLWEVPYFNLGAEEDISKSLDVTKVIDKPPVFPDAEFVSYIGKSKKVLLKLNTNNGAYELEPRVINSAEVEAWQEIAASQFKKLTFDSNKNRFLNSDGTPQTIMFESDDSPQVFEIYRLQSKPESYASFSQALYKTLTPPIMSFVDSINPNTKYWYVFRIIDSHGHYSNPTDVYEFKMIENDGIIYPELTIKTMEEIQAEQRTKEISRVGQKYIQIKPSMLQRMFVQQYSPDVQSATDVEKPSIGTQDRSVFDNGKTYKIRIRSKYTGRKIDINLNFNHVHENPKIDKKAGQ